jgi:hypothetical protein
MIKPLGSNFPQLIKKEVNLFYFPNNIKIDSFQFVKILYDVRQTAACQPSENCPSKIIQ